jgi:PAS domain-containing protein
MPVFKLHLRRHSMVEPDDQGIPFRDLHHAYLEACKAIPDVAREELIAGRDPLVCAFLICDTTGRQLMEVLFSEILSPAEWKRRRAKQRPHGGVRSASVRDDLALTSFRRMFSALNVGCVLMTPELQIVEMNDFGARHSHVDPEAIRGTSILDTFDLAGQPKADFTKFMTLAQQGAVSEIIDMPYLVLDANGATVDGWWNARTWPIFDDDGHMLGLAEWAEPFTTPTNGGQTLRRVGRPV